MTEYAKMKKTELVDLLELRGLDSDGTKAVLIARLQEAHEEAIEEMTPEEDAVIEEPATPEDTGMTRPEVLNEWELQVDAVYYSVLGRKADPQGLYHYHWELKTGNRSAADLAVILANSDEGKALKDLEAKSAHDGAGNEEE